MGRVVRLTEQELRGIVTDLIKMALSGDNLINKENPQDSENNPTDDSSNDKVSAKGQELLNNPIFKKKLKEISNAIHIDENSIIKLMKHESGLNPEIKNDGGCVGLIQFCPDNKGGSSKTIKGKSYTLDELRYNLESQMDAIKEFWSQGYNNGKIKKPADLYIYNFLPIAAGKSDDFVLQSDRSSAEQIALQNPVFNKKLGKPASSPLTVGDLNRYYQMTGMI